MALGAIALAVMSLVQLARGLDDGYPLQVDAAWVASRPEATLFYPDSRVLAHSVRGEQDHPLALSRASVPAQATSVLANPAPGEAVLAWYGQELGGRGWKDVTDQARTARPHSDYARGRREFMHVDILERPPAGFGYSGGASVFAVTYGVNPRY